MNKQGFTLIQLIMVMVILGFLTVVVAPRLSDLPQLRAYYALRKMKSDVRYAQILAIQTQTRIRVVFDDSQMKYSLERETSPGTWSSLIHPAELENYQVTFNASPYEGVIFSSMDLNSGGGSVIFDSYGVPYNASDNPLTEPAYVELNSKYRLQFSAETGKVSAVTL